MQTLTFPSELVLINSLFSLSFTADFPPITFRPNTFLMLLKCEINANYMSTLYE